jgi:hypothetical protein
MKHAHIRPIGGRSRFFRLPEGLQRIAVTAQPVETTTLPQAGVRPPLGGEVERQVAVDRIEGRPVILLEGLKIAYPYVGRVEIGPDLDGFLGAGDGLLDFPHFRINITKRIPRIPLSRGEGDVLIEGFNRLLEFTQIRVSDSKPVKRRAEFRIEPKTFLERLRRIGVILGRILFFGALLLAGLAAFEKLINYFGYTLLRGYIAPLRLLELAAIVLLFVITLQLWQISILLAKKE